MYDDRKTTKPETLAKPYCGCDQEGPSIKSLGATYPEPSPEKECYPIDLKPIFWIQVYLDDGRVFEYTVESQEKVREHASAIVLGGYRHCTREGLFEHYPPHRILKVKSRGIHTMYPDQIRGT